MAGIALIVPVYVNFPGFAKLIHSVDIPITPIIIPNWDDNIGVSKGWNAGLERAIYMGATVAIVSNDDLTFYPGTLSKLIADVHKDTADLVTGANYRDVSETFDEGYDEHPDFACFAVNPRHFVNKFGWFDEQFTPAYFEDNDMAYRIKIAGGTYLRRLDAGMFHQGSVTQNWNGMQVVDAPMFESNRDYYIDKWGGMPGSERFTTPFGR